MSPTKPPASTRPRRSLPTPINSRTRSIREAQDSGTDTENENEAGPSSVGNDVKGKGKEKEKVPERRVLPARIRRSAGGGEGMREVEEMIIDWFERWGEPSTTPPKQLPIHLTSLPLSFVSPPTTKTQQDVAVPTITLTPSRRKAEEGEGRLGKEEKIEVPDWVMVKAGEDDKEEAREELVFGRGGKGKGPVSPVKRLRRGGIGDEVEEDTSDSYYLSLHRKYEVFERRQRIREKEKLQFERYKMKSRLDLLKNIPRLNWILIVNTILQRFTNQDQPTTSKAGEELDTNGETKKEDGISRAKAKIRDNGEEWLKDLLIREGEQLMKRFQELLPPEPRKPKHSSANTPHQPSSRLSTPSRASPSLSPSLTPPPVVLPARVAALRDPPSTVSSTNKRKRRSTIASTSTTTTTADHPAGDEKTPSKGERRSTRVINTYGKNRGDIDGSSPSDAMIIDSSDGDSESEEEEPYSPSEVIIPSTSKTRKATTSAAIMATDTTTQTSLPSKPNFKAINHTQQSIKSFFKPPPPPQNQNQPSITVRPLAPRPSFTTTTATTSKTNSTIVSSLTTSTPAVSTSVRNANNVPAKSAITTPAQRPSSYPIRVPCLIEAASRRESGFGRGLQKEAGDPQGLGVGALNVSRGRSGSISNKRFDNVNGNRDNVTPFGVALPGRLEWKSEFTITDEEDFWPIIAHRQNIRSLINNNNNNSNNDQRKISNGISHVPLTRDDSVLTPEEVEELEGVEEAVVL
ncbi:uncharacterized protein L199_004337 [Kwoniella botswanensis]|uniref:uncharacterized protein n=1 Tax=Kwoniella botswanensis TaxID=1268659 RepID=UPI00315DDA56